MATWLSRKRKFKTAFSSSNRLNDLSNDLLHKILSYLDMKYVVQTSALSKRWRYLWKWVSILNFDNQIFTGNDNDLKVKYEYNFVTQVLRQRRRLLTSAHTISSYYEFCHDHDFGSWIFKALKWNTIQELHLRLHCHCRPEHNGYTSGLDSVLFTYKSLRSLQLDSLLEPIRLEIQLPNSIDLPFLTNLRLSSVRNISAEFLEKIFSGCPVLETIELLNCETDGSTESLTISAHQLKHLVIGICKSRKSLQFIVTAPNLISFECHLHDMTHEDSDSNSEEDVKSIITSLQHLYNVTSLTLDRSYLSVLSKSPGELTKSQSPFVFLRHLKMSTLINHDHLPALTYLLKNSPGIESLAIDILGRAQKWYTIAEAYYWEEKLSLRHLKRVKVQDVRGFTSELEFLKFLLKNAPTLEKITIFVRKELPTYNEGWVKHFTHELLECPRAPLNVKILFCSM